MTLGYACQVIGPGDYTIRSCTRKNATPERLQELIAGNLDVLDRMLDYNIKNGITLFRISSDIIPFGSSPVNTLDWKSIFASRMQSMGEKALQCGMRLSMHPGQYTVLNSPDASTVENAVEDLRYHAAFLDTLGLGQEHKMILHIGGAYGDKEAAIERFTDEYQRLDAGIKRRLVIENDDRTYNIHEVLEIGRTAGIPVVFDNLHNRVNPADDVTDEMEWLRACASTWRPEDGVQKIHYSQQAEGKRSGSHSDSIGIREFLDFHSRIPLDRVDIMLEVKDKNLSAVKCRNALAAERKIQRLETEWARYKYTVLERAPDSYNRIRGLLKDKTAYPAVEFYELLEGALTEEPTPGQFINAALHVWGYFRGQASGAERKRFESLMDAYRESGQSAPGIRRYLYRLAIKYQQQYLLDSLYFIL